MRNHLSKASMYFTRKLHFSHNKIQCHVRISNQPLLEEAEKGKRMYTPMQIF